MPAKNIKRAVKVILASVGVTMLVFAFLPEPILVDIVAVSKGDILVTLEGEGKTRIHDIYVVSTPMEGRVTRIEREPGDIVIAGKTVIANIHPANPTLLDKRAEVQAKADVEGAKAALALASSRVKQSQAQLDFDRQDFERMKELYEKRTVSKVALEQAELRLITLKAELETVISNKNVMQAHLDVAQARLLNPDDLGDVKDDGCRICVHAPVNGRVLRILHKSESIVPVGTALVEIGNPEDLEVNIEMLSTNAVQVNVGDEALIKRWGGDEDIRARVRVIEPSGFTKISALGVEEQRVNILLSFTDPLEKWHSLGDAFRVEAAIIIDRADDVIKIPLSALFRQNEIWSVFKVVKGRVELQEVVVGRRNDRFAEIISGLQVGDQIITHPSNTIDSGLRVESR